MVLGHISDVKQIWLERPVCFKMPLNGYFDGTKAAYDWAALSFSINAFKKGVLSAQIRAVTRLPSVTTG